MTKEELIQHIITEDLSIENNVQWVFVFVYLLVASISFFKKRYGKLVNMAGVVSILGYLATIFLWFFITRQAMFYICETTKNTEVQFFHNIFVWYCVIKYIGWLIYSIWSSASMVENVHNVHNLKEGKPSGTYNLHQTVYQYLCKRAEFNFYVKSMVEQYKSQTS